MHISKQPQCSSSRTRTIF